MATAWPSRPAAPFIGSLDKLFMAGDDPTTAVAATFSKGQYLPDFVYAMFQLTFAAITVALISGAFAERFKFSSMLIFSVLWFTFSYLPVAHMVWYWDGPDAYTTAKAAEVANSHAGFLFQKGALDFAGGTRGPHQFRYRRAGLRPDAGQAEGSGQGARWRLTA